MVTPNRLNGSRGSSRSEPDQNAVFRPGWRFSLHLRAIPPESASEQWNAIWLLSSQRAPEIVLNFNVKLVTLSYRRGESYSFGSLSFLFRFLPFSFLLFVALESLNHPKRNCQSSEETSKLFAAIKNALGLCLQILAIDSGQSNGHWNSLKFTYCALIVHTRSPICVNSRASSLLHSKH